MSFLISPTSGTPAEYLQTASTKTPGIPVDAVPDTPSDRTDHLRLATYRITEQPPLETPAGTWSLTRVQCNGQLVPLRPGRRGGPLNKSQPAVHCVYTDTFSSTPTPELDPSPPSRSRPRPSSRRRPEP